MYWCNDCLARGRAADTLAGLKMAYPVREVKGVTARVASVVIDHQWMSDCTNTSRIVVADIHGDHATICALEASSHAFVGTGQDIVPMRVDDHEQLLADALHLTGEIARRIEWGLTHMVLAGPLATETELTTFIRNQIPDAGLFVASPGLCTRATAEAVDRPDNVDAQSLLQAERYRPTFKTSSHHRGGRRWLRRISM